MDEREKEYTLTPAPRGGFRAHALTEEAPGEGHAIRARANRRPPSTLLSEQFLPNDGFEKVLEQIDNYRRTKVADYFDDHGIDKASAASDAFLEEERRYVLRQIIPLITRANPLEQMSDDHSQAYAKAMAEQLAAGAQVTDDHRSAAHAIIDGSENEPGVSGMLKKIVPVGLVKTATASYAEVMEKSARRVLGAVSSMVANGKLHHDSEARMDFERAHEEYVTAALVNQVVKLNPSDMKKLKDEYTGAVDDLMRTEVFSREHKNPKDYQNFEIGSYAKQAVNEVDKVVGQVFSKGQGRG